MTTELHLTEQPHAWWSPLLAVLLIVALCFVTWAVLHAPLLLAEHRRRLARVRAAKHAARGGRPCR